MAKDSSDDTIKNESDVEAEQTRRRKIEHIDICLKRDVQSQTSSMLDDVMFVHNALPEINKDDIDLTTNFFGLRSNAPIVIAAMTGGHPETLEINRRLAEAAERLRIPIGVGSQRAAIEDRSLEDTFRIVRESAPSVPIIANIGATHVGLAKDAVEMIDADILAIHLNPLQEAIQPEGDCDSRGVISNIAEIVDSVDVPVIAKETGAGISGSVATRLEEVGIVGVDIGGLGGTSWSAVEYYRAEDEGDHIKSRLGLEYWDWGIPTALSIILVNAETDLEIIATGGIRTGSDVAKALSLGATSAGVAFPLLRPATNGTTDDVVTELQLMIESLRVSMYLTGCSAVEDLPSKRLILKGGLVESLRSMDLDYQQIANATMPRPTDND